MQVHINSCLEGARRAHGVAVIIDVFRASNTIIACLDQGADYIIPVDDLDAAYNLKKEHPDHLLIGERGGLPPDGFDYGNSPSVLSDEDLTGKKIIFTTMAGSQGIVNASDADEVLVGSFANADTIVDYVSGKKPEVVSLVPIGFEAHTISSA